jgi:formyltetrahydrofolate deformylase
MSAASTVRLLITCPDRPGIIAAVTSHVAGLGGNIVDVDQHSEPDTGRFFMRCELDRATLGVDEPAFREGFGSIAASFDMAWRAEWGTTPKRVGVLVGPQDHCLSDLLYRWRAGELVADIPLVVSNHESARPWAEAAGIPFHLVPAEDGGDRDAHERAILGPLDDAGVDLVVLARYMRILSPAFVARYPGRIINIHHSFLPAFAGARPYHRAHERGVKIIGATSHYVTDELDEGPIIAQATAAVDHRDDVEDLVRTGRDLERLVLARAVRLHLEDRVLISGRRTVVFEK